MGKIRRLVLDALKPHEPSIVVLAERLSDLDGVGGVNVVIYEIDHKVENAKLTIEGSDVQIETVRQVLVDLGGTIHSIDEVVAGNELVEAAPTPQDK